MIGLIGKKLGMTQIPYKDGAMIAATVIKAGPCSVLQEKTLEKDKYTAIKVGFGDIPSKKLKKPQRGELVKALGEREFYPTLRIAEFRIEDPSQYPVGTELTVELFKEGEKIDVTGYSKGKGFQGVVKRWGFKGGTKTHGSKFHRRAGSIGQTTSPGRIWKGKKMPGRMGGKRVTVLNLEIIKIIPEKNIILVKGAVPGPIGGFVLVRKSKRRND